MAKSKAGLLILSLAISVCMVAISVCGQVIVGGRTEVDDVKNNKQVQSLGRFSVEEFNRMQRRRRANYVYGDLVFSKVIEAQEQVVAGIKYYLKVEVTIKSGETKIFDSVVVVQAWRHSKELLNFAPASN